MKITLNEIKKLRELTKAGIMDCRRALTESKGDFEKAKKWLLEKGMKIAQDKANRETKEGAVASYVHADGRVAALVKVVCETDFVSRNEDFKHFAHEVAMQVAAMKPKTVAELLKQEYIRDPKLTIADLLKEAIGKIKENIKIDSISRLEV